MLKKTLLTAAAALAITGAASGLAANDANAGFKLHLSFGHKHHHFHKFHHFKSYCYTKYKYVKVGYWTKWGYVYKYVWKPVRICH